MSPRAATHPADEQTPGAIAAIRVEGGRKGARWSVVVPWSLLSALAAGGGTWFLSGRSEGAEPRASAPLEYRVQGVEGRVGAVEGTVASLVDAGGKRETRITVTESRITSVESSVVEIKGMLREILTEMRRR